MEVAQIIQTGIAEGIFPGAVVYLGGGATKPYHEAFGHCMLMPEKRLMERETVFDLASLTKPIVVGTLMLRLAERGDVEFDVPFREYVPEFVHPQMTVRHLLTHTSGLPAWRPLYLAATDFVRSQPCVADSPTEGRRRKAPYNGRYAPSDEGAEKKKNSSVSSGAAFIPKSEIPPTATQGCLRTKLVDYLCRLELEYPTGAKVVYSCLGYILLGKLIEKLTGQPLDRLAQEWIFEPLGMQMTRYNPPPDWAERCAATEDSNSAEQRMTNYQRYDWRKGVIVGEVHDENAHFLGGVSGNAGLFSTASDLATFCEMLLAKGDGVLEPESVKQMATVYTNGLDTARSIGWIVLADGSLYHTGFTGTSIRVHLERKLYGILLTNRVHPDASRPGIVEFRSKFYSAVFGG